MKKLLLLFISVHSFLLCCAQNSGDSVYAFAQQMPAFKGDIHKYLGDSLHYPEQERKTGISGTVFVGFIVETDGSVTNVKVLKGVTNGPGLDKEAIRVISGMPKWQPGNQNGKPIRVKYNMPIKFTISDPKPKKDTVVYLDTSAVYTDVEQMPHFTQGNFYDYVMQHINYPYDFKEEHINGVVLLSFIIEKNGMVSHVHIIKGIPDAPGLNQEAVRVIYTMPRWLPGKQYGYNVRVQFTFPINFSMINGKYYSTTDSMYIDYGHLHENDTIYTQLDTLAKPGGDYLNYMKKNFVWPRKERYERMEGSVTVTFVIEKDGTVNLIKILKGFPIGSDVDTEMLDVFANIPKSTPGIKNGKAVRSRVTLTFRAKNLNWYLFKVYYDRFGN